MWSRVFVTGGRPSVCLSVASIDSTSAAGGFAAEVGRAPAANIDRWLLLPRAARGPRKF